MSGALQDKTILSLDLSTSCTGFAEFKGDGQLVRHGAIKASSAGTSKMEKLEKTLENMDRLVIQIEEVILNSKPDIIVIEEIAGSKNRLGQKTLDGFHFILQKRLREIGYLNKVRYYDVTGAAGWRTNLQLRLSPADKENNKEAKKLNKKLARGTTKLPIIGPKHLACRYVNNEYNMTLDVDVSKSDADVADAIAMGSAFLKFRFTKV